MEKKNVPKIRFPGFTEPWEQRKFSELYEKNTEKNVNLIGYDKTISIATMTYKDEGNGASEESLKTYKVLRMGDLAFEGHTNKEFRYGRFVANDIGIGIMSPRFSALRPINEMPISFWKYYIHYEPIMRKILVNSTKAGTMMNELVISDFMEQRIQVPSYEEQNKIGRLFDKLDNLISLHQRKLENLKKQKKGLLQKMFPEKGKKVPEIRFPEFTDDWEQRKLGELGSLKNGMNFSKEAMDKGYPFVNLQNIFGKNVIDTQNLGKAEATQQQLKEYNLIKGDVLFVRSSVKLEGVGEAALVSETLENTTYSGFIIRFRDEIGINDDFKRFIFSTKKVRDQIMSQATNSANKNISQPVLSNLEIELPCFEEQRKIGAFFKQIDNTISLHQRKLEHLQKQKKALLQQMFV